MQASQILQMPQRHTFHSSVTFSEGQVTFSPSFSFSVLHMKMNWYKLQLVLNYAHKCCWCNAMLQH